MHSVQSLVLTVYFSTPLQFGTDAFLPVFLKVNEKIYSNLRVLLIIFMMWIINKIPIARVYREAVKLPLMVYYQTEQKSKYSKTFCNQICFLKWIFKYVKIWRLFCKCVFIYLNCNIFTLLFVHTFLFSFFKTQKTKNLI